MLDDLMEELNVWHAVLAIAEERRDADLHRFGLCHVILVSLGRATEYSLDRRLILNAAWNRLHAHQDEAPCPDQIYWFHTWTERVDFIQSIIIPEVEQDIYDCAVRESAW